MLVSCSRARVRSCSRARVRSYSRARVRSYSRARVRSCSSSTEGCGAGKLRCTRVAISAGH